MSAEHDIEMALRHSTDCLRMAAQLFDIYRFPEVSKYMAEQADKNMQLLLPWVLR